MGHTWVIWWLLSRWQKLWPTRRAARKPQGRPDSPIPQLSEARGPEHQTRMIPGSCLHGGASFHDRKL